MNVQAGLRLCCWQSTKTAFLWSSLLFANPEDRFSQVKAHLDDESSTDKLQQKIVLDELILELKIYSRYSMKFRDVDRQLNR